MPITTKNTLARFRAIADMTRDEAARAAGIPSHTIENIERDRAPLTLPIAKSLEATTGCSAKSLLRGDKQLETLRGAVFSQATMTEWKTQEVDEMSAKRTAEVMAGRTAVLLKVAADRSPGDYRRVLLRVAAALEQIRSETGISFSEIGAVARRNSRSEDKEFSRKELDAILGSSTIYKAERRFLAPKNKLKVRIDRYESWGEKGEAIVTKHLDSISSLDCWEEIWRIPKLDQSCFEVRRMKSTTRGLFDTSTGSPPEVDDE
ncbi:MAG: hypothetical protein NTV93_20870 [Verrucomicrobia bacterium]|nr:hypothetical protein [Verrucomicrobiota bacterium]